ncbi:hypothetical protein HDU83_008650 [Entophlyctis luteolus]|nr:hypothetical protein HDU83_008650 [Entophlyctis luteolus]
MRHNDANYPPEAANAAHNFHAQRFRHRTQLDRLQREQQLEQFRTQMQHQHGSQEQSIHQSNHHLVHNANGSDGFQCTPSASNLGKLNGYMDSPDTFPTAAAATQNNESTASINSQILPIHTHRPQHRSLSATRTSAIAGVTDVIFLLNANGNPIKRRLRANREQLHVLEEVFAQTNGTPSAQCKKDLARRLGMPHKSILYWFQNRRAQIARTQRSHADAVHGASGRSSSGDGVFDGNAMYPLEDGTMASSAREFPKGVEEERDEEEEDDGLDYPAVDVESAEGEQVGEAFQSSVYQPV